LVLNSSLVNIEHLANAHPPRCFRHLFFGDGQRGYKASSRFGVRFDIKHVDLGSLGTRDRL
jgi:hypothetical protein